MSFWQTVRKHKRIYRGPVRDRKFKAFVRTLPCLLCGYYPSQAAHTGVDHGIAQKSSDRTCVNLCFRCHRRYHDIGRKAFERRFHISFTGIVSELNINYEREGQQCKQKYTKCLAAELVAYYAVDPDLAARKPVRNAQVAEPLRPRVESSPRHE